MTLIPLDSIILTDRERYDALVFRKQKLEKQIAATREKYLRDQYASQIKQINAQIVELKPKVKKENNLTEAERLSLERCFMWEAKSFLVKPHYDTIMSRAWARMRIEQKKRLEGK